VTRERLEEARAEADDAVAEARHLHDHADTLVSHTMLSPGERVYLQRARLLLSEAAVLLAQGEYVAARERAERSRGELTRALGSALAVARRFTSSEQLALWRRWVEQTRAWSRATGLAAVVVFKEQNRLVLLRRGEAARSYAADMGSNAVGRKLRRGDRATPEGRYHIVAKKDRGQSRFHRALLLDYPNDADRRRFAEALAAGEVPPGTAPGGLIEIHGEGGRGRNWTDGCVALSNPDMDDLFTRVAQGTWVTIVGGEGHDGAFSTLLAQLDTGSAGGRP
jgi:hypothetical protein